MAPLISRTELFPDNAALQRRRAKDKLWVHPEATRLSRGAGFTVFLPFHTFRGRLLLIILGPEQSPSTKMMLRTSTRISLDRLSSAMRKGSPPYPKLITAHRSTMTLSLITSSRDALPGNLRYL